MSRKRLHHYLPQFYLRGFTDPCTPPGNAPYVWVRDVATGFVSRRAPKNAAAESGYYAIERGTEKDYASVENELAAMESRAAVALRHYLTAPFGKRGGVPSDLGVFLAWLGARVPWLRRVTREMWAKFIITATTVFRAQVGMAYQSEVSLQYYEGYADSPAALRQPGVEITVPLDATHALIGAGRPLSLGMQIEAADINERTAHFADRFVVSPTSNFGRS